MAAEEYQPSSEEFQQAEEMMGSAEAMLTKRREARAQYMKGIGALGVVEIIRIKPSREDEARWKTLSDVEALEGMINGRRFWARRIITPESFHDGRLVDLEIENTDHFDGAVEYEEETLTLSPEEAKKLFLRFYPAAVDLEYEKGLQEQAMTELKLKGVETVKRERERRKQEILEGLI